jgi:hypothetical protein
MRALLVTALLVAAASPARADEGDRWDASTISVQVLGGAGSGLLLGAATGLGGAGIGQLIDSRNWGVPLAGAAIGFVIGGAIGMVAGIDYIGDRRGANGTVLGTSLGLAAGIVVIATIETIAEKKLHKNIPGAFRALEVIVCLVGGPIVGYHLTADAKADSSVRIVLPVFGRGF